jgi:uncharacterized protein (TIGR00299 family) protein
MLLSALLAAGADPNVLSPVEDALSLQYVTSQEMRAGIDATRVEVVRTDERDGEGSDDHSHDDPDVHSHDHSHSDHSHDHTGEEHSHGHSHDGHSHDHDGHTHAEGTGPTRDLSEVIEIVEAMELPGAIEQQATAIFRLLAEAEASVHGTDIEDTHFHEVGADDAIADIVGVCLLLSDLDPDRVVTTPLAAGGGTVEMSHGVYPIPAPAVVELAERADWSLRGGPVEAELLTPTGAAILAEIAEGVAELPSLDVDSVGYGAGTASFDRHPNVLRVLSGTTADGLRAESITVLETHLDDATPEVLGGLQETLQEAGALDVSIVPLTMKKSRPGHLIKVVVAPEDSRQVARELALETGTLGVREHGSGHRFVADRHTETVAVDIDGDTYDVDVKVAQMGETVYDVSAEYDDCRAVAAQTGLSTRAVRDRAERTFREGE